MRGARRKALRRAFEEVMGRAPNGPVLAKVETPGLLAYYPSEWRRLKQGYKRAKGHA